MSNDWLFFFFYIFFFFLGGGGVDHFGEKCHQPTKRHRGIFQKLTSKLLGKTAPEIVQQSISFFFFLHF